MKRIILFFLCSSLTAVHAQSQTESKSYKPTLSESSGNGPTVDNKGYVYNFKGGKLENCFSPTTGYNTVYNQLGSANYSYQLDSANGGVFNLLMKGKQTQSEVLCNHFTTNNCFNVERFATGPINLSDEANRTIEIKVRSSVAVEQFGAYVMVQEKNTMLRLGDGADATSEALPAGKWKVLQLPAVFTTWDEVELDPARVIGIGFYARNASDPQPKGNIEIDYVKIGSAARNFISSGEPTASGQGYVFSFDGDAMHTCLAPINTTGNPDFTFELDATQQAGILQQKITGKRYEIFALEFTDRDCFLQHIALKDNSQYYIEIKIKPDMDIPSFGAALSADRTKDRLWDYGKVQKFVALKGKEWNVVKIPVSMKSQTDGQLDPHVIRGVVLALNPMSLNDKLKEGGVRYEIDYIKVGDAVSQ